MNVRSRCPICWRKVAPTTGSRIGAHWDTAGALCVGGGEPYSITITLDRKALRSAA
jgi:hypothetical protein